MHQPGFLSERHPTSDRTAIFEDDGRSAWLYMTQAGSHAFAADCWLYNRIEAPASVDVATSRKQPPPAVKGVVGERARIEDPVWSSMRLAWSADGRSVAFYYLDVPLGFIAQAEKAGYSRNVVSSSPWGRLWDAERFDALFRPSTR
jgi:hypothetical protein